MKPLQVLDLTKLTWAELVVLRADGFAVDKEMDRRDHPYRRS